MRMGIMLRYLTVVTLMAFWFCQARVEAQITDNNWSSVGGGIGDIVNALTSSPDGTLYAGGIFTSTGSGIPCNRVASWNGSAWSSLGSGITAPAVSSLVFAPGYGVYAGGTFGSAGGTLCSNIAIWDGTIWSPLDSGTNGSVYALAVGASGILYAGGNFTMAGGVQCNYIARWDGTNWTTLGTGMNAPVYTLAIDPISGFLYAGGDFTSADGTPCNNIAQWDGTNWTPVGTGMNNFVTAIAITPAGMLYAGGSFTTAGGVPCNYIARWDGANWNALGLGTDSPVFAMAVAPAGVLYAGGSFTTAGGMPCNNIARWDFIGSSWTALGSGTDAAVSALRLIDTDLYVGGPFTSAGGKPETVGIAKCSLSLTTYTVDFYASSGGSIYGNAAQTVPAGGNCSEVIPLPAEGYAFVNWTGDYTGTDNPLTITNVTSNMTITANFAISPTYTVTFVAGANGTIDGTASQTVNPGGSCSAVTAVPNTGYSFVGWTGDYTGTDNPLTITNVTSNMTITANFAISPTYTVTFVAGANGTIDGTASQTVNSGGNCTPVTAVPNAGYDFFGWTGDYTGADNPLTITNVTSNMTITANFALDNAVAVGKIFKLYPASIAGYTIANFATKPSITATYTIPFSAPPKIGKTGMKLMNKITGVVPSPTFADLEWTKAVKLVNSKEWLKTETCAATILRLFGGTEITPLGCALTTKITFTNGAGVKVKLAEAASGAVALMPPSISQVRFTNPPGAITNVAGPNTPITIYGAYFGKSAPSVWLEYLDGTTVKKLKLKVQKPYAFDNYKGEHFKSCMDISNGDSQITVMTPKWPNGWNHGVPHNIVIDNKVARATIPFNTTP